MRQKATRSLILLTLLCVLALPATAAGPSPDAGWTHAIRAQVELLIARATAFFAWPVDRPGDPPSRLSADWDPFGEPSRLSSHGDPLGEPSPLSLDVDPFGEPSRLSAHVDPLG
jgi:hypothetical protein